MSRAGSTRAELERWGVDHLRFTIFHTDAVFQAKGLWSLITLAEPDSATEKPKSREVLELGKVDSFPFIVHSQVESQRLDFVLTRTEDEDRVSSVTEAVSRIRQFVARWVESGEKIPTKVNRLAVGLRAVLPVTDLAAGYATVSNYLNFDLDSAARDFTFQINRPRESGVSTGVTVNRLTKWFVGRIMRQPLIVTPQGILAALELSSAVETGVNTELDLNTAPDPDRTFAPESFLPHLDEFTRFAFEILSEGDIP